MLKTKVVGIYTVSQMGALEGARIRLFQKQNAEWRAKRLKDNLEVDQAVSDAYDEWATVAACTSPHIGRDEYLAIPYSELRPIIEAMEEVNSDLVSGTETPVVSKKNKP